jgi:hypothetical protein
MAVTEPDIQLIKEEIITILKTNGELWEQDNHEKGFTEINVGLPAQAEFTGLTYPICFVSNDPSLENDQILGNPIGNEIGVSRHVMLFRVIFFDQGATGQDVEKSLDELYKQCKQTLKENFRLNGVQGVIDSFPIRGHSFNFGEFEGQAIDGRVIILRVVVAST